MEFNANFKINDASDYIGITPWAILGFGGSFVAASLFNGGLFFKVSILIFLWGVISSFARQIFKDELVFLRKAGEGNYDKKHKRLWLSYYILQFLFLPLFALFYFIF